MCHAIAQPVNFTRKRPLDRWLAYPWLQNFKKRLKPASKIVSNNLDVIGQEKPLSAKTPRKLDVLYLTM